MKLLLKIIHISLTILLVIIMLSMIYSKIQSKNNPKGVSSVFGYKFLTVLTGSMKPSLNAGDIALAKSVNPTRVKVGDVITYWMNQNTLVTHRVSEIIRNEDILLFRTKGDYNNTEDTQLVSEGQILGQVILRIPKGGYIAQFIRTPLGFVIFIIVPFMLLIMSELNDSPYKAEKDKKIKENLSNNKIKNQ